ncbi:hypothetical protein A3A67_02765 [Candidatus Peribacteria bacterium RIFCSPLOWO2_01_FULL_51_18]|nr:MAG: hypothetical protein A3C52_03380 [Candidatus Peribacteria bacterium RIFCSPHIGHO2_02_FULL_51_15]OGJ66481.1 MAG: hypothetical protein A3A67_02765 [Candidatus Peribacteria bacterium RIFCSPLOWO2_01_FULL_51_18]
MKKTRKVKAKKVKAKKVKTKKAKAKKPASKAKAKRVAAKAKAVKEKVLGKVVHFYDRISVAIIKLKSPLRVGDRVCFKRGEQKLVQSISSLQINHQAVAKAAKGAVVGVKVKKPIKEGAVVMAA